MNYRNIMLGLVLVVAGGLTGCGKEGGPAPNAPNLLERPDLAPNSASENYAANEGQDVVDQRGVAIGANAAVADVHPDVHITTWPYKTTILKHVKPTTDYTDPTGTHWYHIKSGWFKTRYYFIPRVISASATPIEGDPEEFPYPTYEGEILLPIVDMAN